jgi:serine/threonine protein kinase/class 3 adenylate cyclase
METRMAPDTSPPPATPTHRLAALVFTDIVGSTHLKSQLRSDYLSLLSRHNTLFEAGIRETPGAEIVKHTGDGFFAAFPTASDAVRFALVFQTRMRLEPWAPEKIETRLGIHIGEVVFMDMAGRKDIVGLSADIAARLMSLAVGGQILLTGTAFNDARQYVNRSPDILRDAPCLRWIAHGKYLFKGADDPLEVYEVGIDKFSPLSRPADSEKVKRVVPHDEEQTLGWRPAAALEVPGRTGWQLLRKVGEGGFGEVWLGEHMELKEHRVFKFCFDVEQLRSLKREYLLFRLLRETLGQRPDIAALYEVKLDEPPFFLESEYSAGGNLLESAEKHGGIGAIPMPQRLELLAKIADAVAAAHSIGVLHKDIKPANILIQPLADGSIRPLLADFGIGFLSDRSRLKPHSAAAAGMTEVGEDATSKSLGTRMYSPPESMRDTPYTTKGDIYALGVMLYQFVVGDLLRPLAPGWERDVTDELLRQDIAAIVEGDPERRVGTAEEVARRLRTLEARRAEMIKARQAVKAGERRARRRQLAAVAACIVFCVLVLGAIAGAIYIHNLRVAEAKTLAATNFLLTVIQQADPANSPNGVPTAEQLLLDAEKNLDAQFSDVSDVNANLQLAFATALRNFHDPQSIDHYVKAAEMYTKLHGPNDRRTLAAQSGEGFAMVLLQKNTDAEPLLSDVLQRQRSALGTQDRDTLQTKLYYAAAVYSADGAAKAEPLFREALDQRSKVFGEDDKDTIQSVLAYAMVEHDLGRLVDAQRLAQRALDWRRAHFGAERFSTLPTLLVDGSILVDMGRAPEAEPLLKMLVHQSETLGADKASTFRAEAAYADALTADRKFTEAEPLYKRAINGWQHQPDKGQNDDAMMATSGYAELLDDTGRTALAEPLAQKSCEFLQKSEDRRELLRATDTYARTLGLLDKNDQAKAEFEAAVSGAKEAFGPNSILTRRYSQDYQGFLAKAR